MPIRVDCRWASLASQSLDFGIGYRWRTKESNLLLSVRLPAGDASASAEAAITPQTNEQVERPRRTLRPPASIPLWPQPPRRDGFWFWPRW